MLFLISMFYFTNLKSSGFCIALLFLLHLPVATLFHSAQIRIKNVIQKHSDKKKIHIIFMCNFGKYYMRIFRGCLHHHHRYHDRCKNEHFFSARLCMIFRTYAQTGMTLVWRFYWQYRSFISRAHCCGTTTCPKNGLHLARV